MDLTKYKNLPPIIKVATFYNPNNSKRTSLYVKSKEYQTDLYPKRIFYKPIIL